jgi:cytidine deaminase
MKPLLEGKDLATLATSGVIPAPQVQRLATAAGVDVGQLMIDLLPLVQRYAVVPVSGFHVGAVAAGMPVGGWPSLYFGANFEFLGASLSDTLHAEQSAVNTAWLNGERGISALAVSAAPCGYCRQFLYELVTQPTLSIRLPTPTGYSSEPLATYLPGAFGPRDLGLDGGLMDPAYCTHDLTLTDGSTDPFVLQALGAASSSYAPYTGAFAGCAVRTTDGAVFTGRYAENAAYNPTMSPLTSALGLMNVTLPIGANRAIDRVALVEVPAKASTLVATQRVLARYAPGVSVEYHTARLAS